MDPHTNLEELLKIDVACAERSVIVFGELGSTAMASANAGLRVFAAVAKWVHDYEQTGPASEEFNALAGALGVGGGDLLRMLRTPPVAGEDPRITKARGIDDEVTLALAFRTLLQLCWRAYRWGLTDLRRLKLTASAGHLRVEVESAALMILFSRKNEYALRWLNPKEDMRKFFSDTQGQAKGILKDHQLIMAYEHGSAVAQHARFASAARGIRMKEGEVEVLDQEFEPESPVSFHLGVAFFLRMQKRVFAMFPEVFPPLADNEAFKDAVVEFTSLEEKTWWVMERKYEEEIKDFQVE